MITRFAPSPTGPLHLGHAFSAITAFDAARSADGTFLLRLDDIDESRARASWEEQIYTDLHWLGLSWPRPVLRQSERKARYRTALEKLWSRGLLYPCTCSRRDVAAAASAPQEGVPQFGPDGRIYPGTCRHVPEGPLPDGVALRLNMHLAAVGVPDLSYIDNGQVIQMASKDLVHAAGDVVLARPAMAGAYHLCVVIDDADQRITDVIRGADLAEATPIHVLLQNLLALPVPRYTHHRLIRDAEGKRLAKRDDARAIATYRDAGKSPSDIRAMLGLSS